MGLTQRHGGARWERVFLKVSGVDMLTRKEMGAGNFRK